MDIYEKCHYLRNRFAKEKKERELVVTKATIIFGALVYIIATTLIWAYAVNVCNYVW